MKIRILGNSIRLRLTQSEVKNIAEKGKIEERTQFGGMLNSTLIYSLEKKETTEINADFSNNHIQVVLPEKTADEWANSNQVGIENKIQLSDGSTFRILIEKDFKCLTERGEDESDHFPNPADSC